MDVSLDLLTHTHDHACPRARIVLQIIHRLFKFPFCSNLLALNNLHSILFYFSSIMWAPSFNFLNLKLEINIKYNYCYFPRMFFFFIIVLHVCFLFFFSKIDDFFFFFFFCFFYFFFKIIFTNFFKYLTVCGLLQYFPIWFFSFFL